MWMQEGFIEVSFKELKQFLEENELLEIRSQGEYVWVDSDGNTLACTQHRFADTGYFIKSDDPKYVNKEAFEFINKRFLE